MILLPVMMLAIFFFHKLEFDIDFFDVFYYNYCNIING